MGFVFITFKKNKSVPTLCSALHTLRSYHVTLCHWNCMETLNKLPFHSSAHRTQARGLYTPHKAVKENPVIGIFLTSALANFCGSITVSRNLILHSMHICSFTADSFPHTTNQQAKTQNRFHTKSVVFITYHP